MSRYEHLAIESQKSLAEVANEITSATGIAFTLNRDGEYAANLGGHTLAWLTGPDQLGEGFDELAEFNYDVSIQSDTIAEQEAIARKIFDAIKRAGRPLPIALALNDYQREFEIFPGSTV